MPEPVMAELLPFIVREPTVKLLCKLSVAVLLRINADAELPNAKTLASMNVPPFTVLLVDAPP